MFRNKRYRKNQQPQPSTSASVHKQNVPAQPAEKRSRILAPGKENEATMPPKKARQEIPEGGLHEIPEERADDIFSSQASVPASQPPTQRRYLSQRCTLRKTQSSNLKRLPSSYFEMALMHSGVDLDQNDALVLSCDDITFVNQFTKTLKKTNEEQKNAEIFINGFKEILKHNAKAIKFLIGYNIVVRETGTVIQSQISMTGNFLMIDILQKGILELLLERIKFYAENDENDNGDVALLPLILSHLRYVSSFYGDFVYEKIIEIFQSATPRSKREIISGSEYILDPRKHDDFVLFLLNNISSREELLNDMTVTTFGYLHINPSVQRTLRRKILEYIREDCPLSLWPSFTKFLLEIVADDEDSLNKLISDLRNSLNFGVITNENDKDVQMEIFKHIKHSLIISKKLFDTWQKIINNIAPLDFKPFDLIILLIMLSTREEKSQFLENILRRRILQEQISLNIVAESKTLLPSVFENYAKVLLNILQDFLKDKRFLIVNFSKQAIKVIFEVDAVFQRKVLGKLVEMITDRGSTDAIAPLEVLKELNESHPEELQHWGLILLPLLDGLNEMNLKQSRLVMRLLCSIIYPPPPFPVCEYLKDHLEKIVKKQIINRLCVIKNQGIVGTVQLIDHAIRIEETEDINIYEIEDDAFHNMADIPNPRGKQMANYVGLIISASRNSPETLALFYDELASEFSPKNKGGYKKFLVERNFFSWLLNLVTHYFQKDFVIEEAPVGLGLDLESQNCINAPEDTSGSELVPISINIAGPVLKPPSEASSSIIVLSSIFNLVKTLHYIRYNGSLETINALLGCGIMLPSFVGSSTDFDIFDEYDDVMAKKIMDIHFHTVNWYREIIGSFAKEEEPMYRRKVLQRLYDLIQLEERIRLLLTRAPSNFSLGPQLNTTTGPHQFKKPAAGRPKVAAKRKEPSNTTAKNTKKLNQTKPTTNSQAKQKLLINFEGGYSSRENYRQIDPDIMFILREELELKYPLLNSRIGQCIGLTEFRFIMIDLVNKMEYVAGNKSLNSGKILQDIMPPVDFIRDIINQLPKLMEHFKKILDALISSTSPQTEQNQLYSDEMNYLKVCFGLCLRFLATFFSWSDFRNKTNENLLKDSMGIIIRNSSLRTTPDAGIDELARKTCDKFLKLEKHVIYLPSAIDLYHLCENLLKHAEEKNGFQKLLRDLCQSFLCRKWYGFDGTVEKGAACNSILAELLKSFFKNLSLKNLKEITNIIFDQAKYLKTKNDVLRIFPNFHKLNFPILFKEMAECLVLIISNNNNLSDLRIWEESCEVLNLLLKIIKSMEVPRNFPIFLKCAHQYIKIFLQKGLPVIENILRKCPERVNNLLKNIQQITRFLHHLCCHSKVIKHGGIVSLIPGVRETIENLVIRVKAALVANKCSSVFWLGNLKNKDLHGDEILSQNISSIMEQQPPESEDDDIPDDDSTDNTAVLGDDDELPARDRPSTSKESLNDSTRSLCL